MNDDYTVKLNDGKLLPKLGFGTYQCLGAQGSEAVLEALHSGYRLIDSAEMYANEREIQEAVLRSGIPREEILITSKVWKTNMSPQNTRHSFYKTLENLKSDYLDLYLIHWPATKSGDKDWEKINIECWQTLEQLQQENLIKTIGVCNFGVNELQSLLDYSDAVPAINQVEFHPGYSQQELYDICNQKGIKLQAWSPLARGRVFNHSVIQEIAAKHHKNPAQICIRWCVDKGVIPLPKSNTPLRIRDNFDVFNFKLSAQEISRIDEIPEVRFQ